MRSWAAFRACTSQTRSLCSAPSLGSAPRASIELSTGLPCRTADFHLGRIGAAPSNVPSASAAASFPDMPPLKLTGAELDAVFNAARPLAPNVREDFLKEVADRLSSYRVVGPGTVHRVCLETQRRFFDPPDLGGPGVWVSRAPWRSDLAAGERR
jgi:hypothetical protein